MIIKKHRNLFTHNCIASGTPYLTYISGDGVVDGIGRMHISLYAICDICDNKFLAGKIHVDKNSKLYKKKK